MDVIPMTKPKFPYTVTRFTYLYTSAVGILGVVLAVGLVYLPIPHVVDTKYSYVLLGLGYGWVARGLADIAQSRE